MHRNVGELVQRNPPLDATPGDAADVSSAEHVVSAKVTSASQNGQLTRALADQMS
jgi:hypothetical protein